MERLLASRLHWLLAQPPAAPASPQARRALLTHDAAHLCSQTPLAVRTPLTARTHKCLGRSARATRSLTLAL